MNVINENSVELRNSDIYDEKDSSFQSDLDNESFSNKIDDDKIEINSEENEKKNNNSNTNITHIPSNSNDNVTNRKQRVKEADIDLLYSTDRPLREEDNLKHYDYIKEQQIKETKLTNVIDIKSELPTFQNKKTKITLANENFSTFSNVISQSNNIRTKSNNYSKDTKIVSSNNSNNSNNIGGTNNNYQMLNKNDYNSNSIGTSELVISNINKNNKNNKTNLNSMIKTISEKNIVIDSPKKSIRNKTNYINTVENESKIEKYNFSNNGFGGCFVYYIKAELRYWYFPLTSVLYFIMYCLLFNDVFKFTTTNEESSGVNNEEYADSKEDEDYKLFEILLCFLLIMLIEKLLFHLFMYKVS